MRKVPAIRVAAGIVLVLGGLLAALGALWASGFLHSRRPDDFIEDSYYAAMRGHHLLSWMAFVVVNAAGVMALGGAAPPRGRLAMAALWTVLAGAALILAMTALGTWFASTFTMQPRLCGHLAAYYDTGEACGRTIALQMRLLAATQWTALAAVVCLLGGWLLWLIAWLRGRARAA